MWHEIPFTETSNNFWYTQVTELLKVSSDQLILSQSPKAVVNGHA